MMDGTTHTPGQYVCRSLFRAAALLALGGRYRHAHRSGSSNLTSFVFDDPDRCLRALDGELRRGDTTLPFRAFASAYRRLRAEHRALHGGGATRPGG